jgi:hypothetical protein
LSPKTLRQWLYAYRHYGLDGLKRKPRNDKGASRALTSDVARAIQELRQLYPKKTVTALYTELLAGGFLGLPPVSLSTVGRYLKKFDPPSEPEIERKRFVFACANDCWQTDALAGPYLNVDGRKKATYLIAFLDDAPQLRDVKDDSHLNFQLFNLIIDKIIIQVNSILITISL